MHDKKSTSAARGVGLQTAGPAPVQLRESALVRSLRGASFEEGEGMLAPGADASVQMRGRGAASAADIQARAAEGVAGGGGALPYLGAIQRSFGSHDVSGVQAHQGSDAQGAARDIGAEAYATGNHVAFGGAPDLFTAAHEAAHVVQQRAGVQLAGGVGAVGDTYERQADQVAHAVVRGESAEGLLGSGGASASGGPVQMARGNKNGGGKGGGQRKRRGGKPGARKGGGGGKSGGAKSSPKSTPKVSGEPSPTTETPTSETTETTSGTTETTSEKTETTESTETKSETTETTETTNTAPTTEAPSETPVEEAPKPVIDKEGKKAWTSECKRLIDMIPAKLTDHRTVLSKVKWRGQLETVFADDIADFTEASWAKDMVVTDIATNAGARASTWMDHVWKTVGELKGKNVPTKGELWSFLGWQIKGQEWDMKHVAAGPSGTPLHITASGNSIPAPSTIVGGDPEILQKDPASLYQALFESAAVQARVHVTRESQPKKHLFIGNVNGDGRAIGDTEWGGDAATMKGHLATFRSNAIAKLTDAKVRGWKLT